MTRIAAIYDLHGNLPALEAILGEIAGVDLVVVGGDVVPGPMPRECLERLLALDVPVRCIVGNGENDALTHLAGHELARVPPQYRDIVRWSAEQVAAYEPVLRSWPATLRIDDVLFCHATPDDDNAIFTRATAEARLVPRFAATGVPLVVCGHTHMQFDRMIGGVRVVNAGSAGMPFGDPGAHWLSLEPEVRLRRTAYDIDAAAARITATAYPDAAGFVTHALRQPPPEETMLAAYARVEI